VIKDKNDIEHLPLWTIVFRYNRCRILLEGAKERKTLLGGWDKVYLEAALEILQDDRP